MSTEAGVLGKRSRSVIENDEDTEILNPRKKQKYDINKLKMYNLIQDIQQSIFIFIDYYDLLSLIKTSKEFAWIHCSDVLAKNVFKFLSRKDDIKHPAEIGKYVKFEN